MNVHAAERGQPSHPETRAAQPPVVRKVFDAEEAVGQVRTPAKARLRPTSWSTSEGDNERFGTTRFQMEILSFFGADLIHSAAFRGLALFLEVVLLALACLVVFEGFRRIGRDGVSTRIIVVVLLGLTVAVMCGVTVTEAFLETDIVH